MRTLKVPNHLYDTFIIFLDLALARCFQEYRSNKLTPKERETCIWAYKFVRQEEKKHEKK